MLRSIWSQGQSEAQQTHLAGTECPLSLRRSHGKASTKASGVALDLIVPSRRLHEGLIELFDDDNSPATSDDDATLSQTVDYGIFSNTSKLLQSLSIRRPLIILLEDIHTDHPTLSFVEWFLNNWSARVLFILTATDEVLQSNPLEDSILEDMQFSLIRHFNCGAPPSPYDMQDLVTGMAPLALSRRSCRHHGFGQSKVCSRVGQNIDRCG